MASAGVSGAFQRVVNKGSIGIYKVDLDIWGLRFVIRSIGDVLSLRNVGRIGLPETRTKVASS